MKRKINKLILLLSILTFSCVKDKKTELTLFLTNDSLKYWDMVYNPRFYDRSKSLTFPLYCYCFEKSNKWNFYIYRKGVRQQYEQDDIVIPRKWDMISDTTIMLGFKTYKIEKLSKDTFIYIEDTDTTILINSMIK
jgi:hypothetical protein